MKISHLSPAVRYTGRWAKREDAAITTTPGAYFEAAFTGTWCDLKFDMTIFSEPMPHLYIQLDGGAKIDVRIAHFIRVEAPNDGNHVVTVYFKNAMELLQRWYEPLAAKVAFIGMDAEGEGSLPNDNRKFIQFLGDSITEGTWTDEERSAYGNLNGPHARSNLRNTEYMNDSTATYAYLTAKELNMRPYIMGYGFLGLTKPASGGVPVPAQSYPYCFNGHPIEPVCAEITVINYGANDFACTAEEYIAAYEEFLPIIRKHNPTTKIVVLSAFLGRHPKELGEMVERYNKRYNENVLFIDSAGWIPYEPIHPTRDGHKTIANNLSAILREKYGL